MGGTIWTSLFLLSISSDLCSNVLVYVSKDPGPDFFSANLQEVYDYSLLKGAGSCSQTCKDCSTVSAVHSGEGE